MFRSKVITRISIHTGESHWICAYRDAGDTTVHVLDSLRMKPEVSTHTLLQLATVFKPPAPSDHLNIQLEAVQQQRGLHDVGLFAITFMIEVCQGKEVGSSVFSQCKMREHLKSCLENGHMSAFPRVKSKKDDQMMCCNKFNKWYHCSCVEMKTKSRGRKSWKCQKCCSLP